MTCDRETQKAIDRCRAANGQLKARLIAATAAFAFLVVLAVVQFVVVMLVVRTVHDLKEESERTRREALETLERLKQTREEGRTARDKPDEMLKNEKSLPALKDARTKIEGLDQPVPEPPSKLDR
jgi:hypothetical protein